MGLLWLGGTAGPCHATSMPMLAPCMGKHSGKAALSAAFHFSQTCLLQHGGFSALAAAAFPFRLVSILLPCLCSSSAPFNLDSSHMTGCGATWSPGGAMPGCPGSWRREAEVSRGVHSLSMATRQSPGDSLSGAAPAVSWSQGRLQTMGGEQETPHGKQDLAPPPPPATAPWPLSFPYSREPFPQPWAEGLR